MQNDLTYYRGLPYTRRAEPVQEGEERPYWIAYVEELPGCKTDGETRAEAMVNLDAAFDDYVEAMLDAGRSVPEPAPRPRASVRVYEPTVRWGDAELKQAFMDVFRQRLTARNEESAWPSIFGPVDATERTTKQPFEATDTDLRIPV